MILADKIINERKRNGWSQEELADQLSVSRQSISKWEGAQAIPDIQKIIKMAELFGVSTDYLLRDELEPESAHTEPARIESVSGRATSVEASVRKVSMEEANNFLNITVKVTPLIANGVSLCILSPVLLIVLSGLAEAPGFGLSENAAAGIGIVMLLVLVAAAVTFFIVGGSKLSPYEYLETKIIDTEYGVNGMVTEKKKAYETRHTALIVLGVVLCILCVVPLLVAFFLEVPDYAILFMVGVLLALVAAGVNLLVRAGNIWESYQKLLQEGDYAISEKRHRPTTRKIASIYWGVVTAVYLGWSFWTMRWDFTWLVWPVAGILFAVVITIAGMFLKSED